MNISAVIPLYNAEKYIAKAIDSLLNQTIPISEILVVDDGSIDKGCSVIEAYNKEHIKIVKQANAGVSIARNVGIEHASGDWILFLDADDECDSHLLESYIEVLQATKSIHAIYSDAVQIDENSHVLEGKFSGITLHGKQGFVDVLKRNPIISPSGCLVKKDILVEMDGFDTSMRYAEDVDLWLRILYQGGTIFHLAQPLSRIRRHTSNTTSNINMTKSGERQLLDKYGLEIIKEAIDSGQYSDSVKQLDFLNFLIRFDKWNEASLFAEGLDFDVDEHPVLYISYLFTRVIIQIQFENFREVKRISLYILDKQPDHGASLNNVACVYAMEQQYDLAHQYLLEALSYFPGYMDATYNLKNLREADAVLKFTKRELRKSLLRYS